MSWYDSVVQGMLNGFGSAIGSYLAIKYSIKHLENMPSVKEKAKHYSSLLSNRKDP